MKIKLSISLDEDTLQKVEERLKNGSFRNRSHVVEFAIKSLGEGGK